MAQKSGAQNIAETQLTQAIRWKRLQALCRIRTRLLCWKIRKTSGFRLQRRRDHTAASTPPFWIPSEVYVKNAAICQQLKHFPSAKPAVVIWKKTLHISRVFYRGLIMTDVISIIEYRYTIFRCPLYLLAGQSAFQKMPARQGDALPRPPP